MKQLCLHPYWPKDKTFSVPCGHCRACRIKRRTEWAARLCHEIIRHNHHALYITLTYKPSCLPPHGTLVKEHWQSLIMNIRLLYRRNVGRNNLKKISYYACGEYGGRRFRPHYHAIVFGLTMDYAEPIFNLWNKCEPQAYKCEYALGRKAMSYVAGYTCKKLRQIENQRYFDAYNVIPPFQLISQGIGKDFALNNEYLLKTGYLRVNGSDQIPPRYYRKILNFKSELYERDILDREAFTNAKYADMLNTTDVELIAQAKKRAREYVEFNNQKSENAPEKRRHRISLFDIGEEYHV